MAESSSFTNTTAPTIDWADDTDEEIDFGAPVFSDDEDLPPELTRGVGVTPTPSVDTVDDHSSRQEDKSPYRDNNRNRDRVTSDGRHSSSPRYTAGFADGSNRSLDRRSHNDSSLKTMSSRARTRDHSSPYRDTPNDRLDRTYSSSGHLSTGRGPGSSYERESHWRSDGRREDTRGKPSSSYGSTHADGKSRPTKNYDGSRSSTPGQRSVRQLIPLPPKPPAALDANHQPRIDRSRSPSYRSRSPMAGTERQWDHSRQRPSSPYSGNIRSPSPNNNSHLPSGLSTRSHSPGRGSRAHMDQVASSKDHSKRRSRDLAPDSGGRWEKTPHEDRPYPMLHPPALAASSPKDDVIYFKRREGRANEPSSRDRDASGTMYHERLNTNDSRHRGTERVDGPGDRWGKNTAVEPDRPYPERPRPSPDSGNNHGKHSRTRSRDQINILPVTPSPTLEKVSPRGNRGRGKDQHKRKSNEPPPFSSTNEDGPQDTDKGSAVPWWEQSTYGPKSKKEEPAVELSKDSREEKIAVATKRASSSTGATKARSGAKETSSSSQDAKEEVPWWEQSTYKLKPKVAEAVDQVTSQLAGVDMKSSSSTQGHGNSDSLADADIVAKRKALGQKAPTSGVEAMTLVSRGGDDSGSSRSIKARNIQERVFSEIKAMISKYEAQYGHDKLKPIPPRTRQADEMDKILESFRKLREGLFATETRDIFAVQVYEQSILCSLYAGNIPELTKALQHLVHDLHPQVYKITPRADPSLLPEIPLERQRFLALYILHQVAKPIRKRVTSTSSSIGTLNLLSQTIAHPKTETDQLIASLLQVYEQLRQQRPSEYALESEVVFALAYWKSLRDGNWILRERLLSAVGGPSVCLPALLQNTIPISWEQRLMIQRSMGDSLGSARSMSVGMMSKAYYSLPVSVMAHAVGLTESQEEYTQTTPVDAVTSEQWVKELQASYGLAPSIIVRSGSLMFKAKS